MRRRKRRLLSLIAACVQSLANRVQTREEKLRDTMMREARRKKKDRESRREARKEAHRERKKVCGNCVYCGRYLDKLSKDHTPPQALYSDDRSDKPLVVWACKQCNNSTREHPTHEQNMIRNLICKGESLGSQAALEVLHTVPVNQRGHHRSWETPSFTECKPIAKWAIGLLCYNYHLQGMGHFPLDWTTISSQKSPFAGWHLTECSRHYFETEAVPVPLINAETRCYYSDREVCMYKVAWSANLASVLMTFYEHLSFFALFIRPLEQQVTAEKSLSDVEQELREGYWHRGNDSDYTIERGIRKWRSPHLGPQF